MISIISLFPDNRSRDRLSLLTGATDGPIDTSQSVSRDGLSQQVNRPNPLAFHQPTGGTRPGPIGTLQSDSAQAADTRGPRPFGDGRSDGDVVGLPRKLDFFNRLTSTNPPEDSSTHRTILGSSPMFGSSQNWGHRDTSKTRNANISGTMFCGTPANLAQSSVSNQDGFRPRRGGFNNQWVGNQRGVRYSQGGYHRRGSRQGGNFGWSRVLPGLAATNEPTFSGEYDYEKANAELAVELEKISISVVIFSF